MNDIANQWDIIAGFFVPLLVSVINQAWWRSSIKAVVAFVVMLVVAIGTAWVNHALDSSHILPTVFYVVSTAIVSYKGLWQHTGVTDAIEKSTTV